VPGYVNLAAFYNDFRDQQLVFNINVNWDKVMGSPVDVSFFMTNVTNVTNDNYPVALGSALSSNGYETFNYAPPRM
jgi:iron complex outermembrane receptor protein